MLRLAHLLHFFSYSFLCGDMVFVVKKKVSHQNQVLSPLIKHFIRENLKLKNSMIDDVCWVVHRHHEIRPFLDMMKKQEEVALSEEELLSLGNLLFASKNLWPLMVVQAVVSEVWEGQDREEVMRAYGRLMQYVREKELMRMWEIPSIVNGNELVTYGVKKGPGMKDVMDAIRNWMILHPHGTKEECVREVLSYPK